MAQQTRKWNPGDAANAFVRVILSDAGTMLGGMSDDEWQRTLGWFDGRCAYTGEELAEGETDRDHAIPMSRAHCGLHLYGNVLPATREANRRKAGKHYREFVDDPERLERIEAFVRESEYWDKVSDFGDLQRYCEVQYRAIDALCRVNRKYLASLLPEADEEDAAAAPETPRTIAIDPGGIGHAPDHPGPTLARRVQGGARSRATSLDRREPPRRQASRAALGSGKNIRLIERPRESQVASALSQGRLEAARNRVLVRVDQAALTARLVVDESEVRGTRGAPAKNG